MDSNEIEDILSYDKHFMGCFASNQLPSVASPFPKSLIINTAPSDTVSEHWVALVLYKNKCFYFDSFGLPVLNQDILHFLCKYKRVTYTDVCIQSTFSDYCGKFCIAFIKNVHSRHSYDDFIDQFDFVNLYKNDAIVENIYL